MAQLTWLVTGCSSGLGEEFIHGILARGDKAIATSRGPTSRISKLQEAGAKTYSLDVTASQSSLSSNISTIIQEVGGIDVLVNNAGYVESGTFEETTYESYLAQFETNVFGAIKTTQAVLPHFRQKRSGTVAFIGSMYGFGGIVGAAPYCGTKFALEGLTECLKESTSQFSIKSIIFEAGYFRTEVLNANNLKMRANLINDYDELRTIGEELVRQTHGSQLGDPKKAIKVMIDVIKGEGIAASKDTPDRLPLGPDALELVRKKCIDTLAICDEWDSVIRSTSFD